MGARLAPVPDRARADFLAFVEDRPDEERWELIDGVRAMQASASLIHAILAGAVTGLINDALEKEGSPWLAIQAARVDLTAVSPGSMYIPDVLVIDADEVVPGQTLTERCLVAVEVVSPSDRRRSGKLGGRRKIDVKVERYRTLPVCEAILIVAQDSMDLELHVRSREGWAERRFIDPAEEIRVEAVGLTCRLRDLYRRVPAAALSPRR